jgi:hypothetical protein
MENYNFIIVVIPQKFRSDIWHILDSRNNLSCWISFGNTNRRVLDADKMSFTPLILRHAPDHQITAPPTQLGVRMSSPPIARLPLQPSISICSLTRGVCSMPAASRRRAEFSPTPAWGNLLKVCGWCGHPSYSRLFSFARSMCCVLANSRKSTD